VPVTVAPVSHLSSVTRPGTISTVPGISVGTSTASNGSASNGYAPKASTNSSAQNARATNGNVTGSSTTNGSRPKSSVTNGYTPTVSSHNGFPPKAASVISNAALPVTTSSIVGTKPTYIYSSGGGPVTKQNVSSNTVRKEVEMEEQTKSIMIPDYDEDSDDDELDSAAKAPGRLATPPRDYPFSANANGDVAPLIFSGLAAKRLLQSHPGEVGVGGGGGGVNSDDIFSMMPNGGFTQNSGSGFERQVRCDPIISLL